MMTLLRKHRQWLMIVIGILAIPFIFYFVQKPDYGAVHSDQMARIYDRNISRIEFQRNARLFNLARELGMYQLLQDLVAGANSENEAFAEFTANRLILQHEAEKLGIRPTTSEIANVVKTLRVFQGDAGFDLKKYTDFTQNVLPSLGFTDTQIEELAADQINLDRIKQLLASGVNISESESRARYAEAFGKMDVAVVRFHNQDIAKDLKIADADIAKYYETHKAELKTDETRKVQFVNLALTDEQKKLKDKARIDVLQQLADRANDFTQVLLEKGSDFRKAAEKFKIPLKETGEFKATAPDPLLKADPQLAQAAFQLSAEQPNSDALQTPDGFYILHLAGVTPSRPLTLDEAKPKIVDSLKQERTREMLASKAAEAKRQIEEKIKAGAPVAAAIQQAGLKAETIPPFSLMDDAPATPDMKKETKEAPDLPSIKQTAAEMRAGEVSAFVPTADGGLIAVLEKRVPVEEAEFVKKRTFIDSRMQENMRRIVFYEWLRDRRRDANFQMAAAG
jgi:peptidyl-prolyl cis-trans isomerase D